MHAERSGAFSPTSASNTRSSSMLSIDNPQTLARRERQEASAYSMSIPSLTSDYNWGKASRKQLMSTQLEKTRVCRRPPEKVALMKMAIQMAGRQQKENDLITRTLIRTRREKKIRQPSHQRVEHWHSIWLFTKTFAKKPVVECEAGASRSPQMASYRTASASLEEPDEQSQMWWLDLCCQTHKLATLRMLA